MTGLKKIQVKSFTAPVEGINKGDEPFISPYIRAPATALHPPELESSSQETHAAMKDKQVTVDNTGSERTLKTKNLKKNVKHKRARKAKRKK